MRLWRTRRALANALALHRRGEARSDGLSLLDLSIKLTVNWRARDIHPWDRDLPQWRAGLRLVDQTMHDTEDAVERIFFAFPDANELEFNVFESDSASNRVIMSGVVARSDVGRCESSSITMRLKMLGISYRLVEDRLEAIALGVPSGPAPQQSGGATPVDWPVARVGRQTDLAAKSRPRWPD